MTGSTSIEWTDRTWNPVTGCTKVSPGCDRCYADAIARRFAGTPAFPNGFAVTLRPDRLTAPMAWRRPSRVFVNSMSDLFHDQVPDTFIARVWAVMAGTGRHTYQVLTKRHGRMRALLRSPEFRAQVRELRVRHVGMADHDLDWPTALDVWPPRNVWVGVSAEDQARAGLRVPALLATPAEVRFVSAEPLLGPIDLRDEWAGLDWLIIGGESGPGARRMDPAWADTLVARCRVLGVAPFVKQLGSAHGPHKGADVDTWPAALRVREFPTPTTTTPDHPLAAADGRPCTPTGGAA